MKILSIELTNYRQYRDTQKIEFGEGGTKNVTVIVGVNGAGKTNLLNAINWCLYGLEENLKADTEKKQGVINDQILEKLKAGQIATAKVTITGLEEDGHQVIFERMVEAHKNSQNNVVYHDPNFFIMKEHNNNWITVTAPSLFINRILPEALRHFFIFDGEKLNQFFKEENVHQVKRAIFDVSQLSLLDTATEHLEKTLYDIRSEIKGTPKIDELREKIETFVKSKELLISDRIKVDESRKEAHAELQKIKEQLRGVDAKSINELHKKREEIEDRCKRIEEEIERDNQKLTNKILESFPLVFCFDAIDGSIAKIREKTNKGELPPKIKNTFLKELIESGECICGSDLNDKTKRKRIEQLIESVMSSGIAEYIAEGRYTLQACKEMVRPLFQEIEEIGVEISENDTMLKNANSELEEITVKLKNSGSTAIINLEYARESFEQQIEKANRELGQLDERIKWADKEVGMLNQEFEREISRLEKHNVANKKLKIGTDVLAVYHSVKGNLIGKIRATAEQKTKEYFLSLIWKKQTYNDVRIDENYNVSVINLLGKECLGTLSAGERQVLALSFLAGLRDVSGFEAPIVIDSPLGRISGEPRENIAELLPTYFNKSQVILLVTDEEYTQKVRSILLKRVWKEYKLDYEEKESKTHVIQNGK